MDQSRSLNISKIETALRSATSETEVKVVRKLNRFETDRLRNEISATLNLLFPGKVLRGSNERIFFSDRSEYESLEIWSPDRFALAPSQSWEVYAEFHNAAFEFAIQKPELLHPGSFGVFEMWLKVKEGTFICLPHYPGTEMRILSSLPRN